MGLFIGFCVSPLIVVDMTQALHVQLHVHRLDNFRELIGLRRLLEGKEEILWLFHLIVAN